MIHDWTRGPRRLPALGELPRLGVDVCIQSSLFETHQDAARVAHEYATRLMVEFAPVIDRKTGEVKHSVDGIIRTTRKCWGRKQA